MIQDTVDDLMFGRHTGSANGQIISKSECENAIKDLNHEVWTLLGRRGIFKISQKEGAREMFLLQKQERQSEDD